MIEQYALFQAVRQTIEPLLIEHGFALTGSQQDPFDVLRYERATDDSHMTFHNDREIAIHLGEARVFVAAYARGTQRASLMSLKELLPDFLSIPIMERGWWTYRNQDELSVCLEEILQIIKERLFDWFEHPVSNPAKVPLPPAAKLTPDKLRMMIISQEYSIERARNEGRLEDVERREQSLEGMRRSLDRLLVSEADAED